MRRLVSFIVVGAGLAAAPAQAAFSCAKPAAVLPVSDENKAINLAVVKRIKANPWLGAQDGTLCVTPDGRGRFWHFAGGSVYWSPASGARAVRGLIRQHWAGTGWEQGPLGYPISDEIDTYDGLAKVSKFQGGQLIWRPWTNKVTAVMTTELPLDLPTPTGEVWQVIQANAVNDGDSHGGTFAYCYDFAAANGETKDKPFLSTANARIDQVLQGSDMSTQSNVVVQHLGLGRYASSLHVAKNSFAETFGKGKVALTLATPWPARPFAKTGDTIAKVGKTGTGGEHIHFCVTTAPDGTVFTPFESVPMTFRNFESSADGVTWQKVSTGRPIAGTFVRHGAALNPNSPANLAGGEKLLHFGGISGALRRFGGKPWLDGSVVVQAVSGWGEPLGSSVKVSVSAASGTAPLKYSLPAVPNFPLIHVEATFIGAKLQPKLLIAKGDSKVMTVAANSGNVADVTIPF